MTKKINVNILKRDENEEYSGEISIESGVGYAHCEYSLSSATKTITGSFEGEFSKLAQVLAQLHLIVNTFAEPDKPE